MMKVTKLPSRVHENNPVTSDTTNNNPIVSTVTPLLMTIR